MDPIPDGHIIVINYNKTSLAYLKKSPLVKKSFSWAYLGKEVSHFLELGKILGKNGKNIPISPFLQDNAKKYRQDFINQMGICAAGSNDPWWYIHSISEKNPFVSDLFLNFCYLKTFLEISQRHKKGTFFIICEMDHLVKAIGENFHSHLPSIEIHLFISNQDKIIQPVVSVAFRLINKTYFVLRFLTRITLTRYILLRRGKRNLEETQGTIIIHSWTDKRSFPTDGEFRESYFGALAQKIENSQKHYFFLLDVLPTISFINALKKIRKIKKPWHLFEEFLTYSDVISALNIAAKVPSLSHKQTIVSGLSISELIAGEFTKDHKTIRTDISYLYYVAGRRMAEANKILSFIYTFENHIWEKMMIRGIRERSNTARIIGYAHATVNSMELSYSVSPSEKRIIPLPDSILVNGVIPHKVLVDSGFDPEKVHILGSLRFGNLFSGNKRERSKDPVFALVILSADVNRSLEMITKCYEAFLRSSQIHIGFKTHPAENPKRIETFVKGFPKWFELLPPATSMNDALAKADVVLYSDSTAAVEAGARGIPLIHIRSDFLIDTNFFETITDIVPSVSSPEEILAKTSEVLERSEIISKKYEETIAQIIRDLFSPVDDNMLVQEIRLNEEL